MTHASFEEIMWSKNSITAWFTNNCVSVLSLSPSKSAISEQKMTLKSKLNMLSVKDKVEVIKPKEQNHSIEDLCIKLRCRKTNLWCYKKKLKVFESGSSYRKTKSIVKTEDTDVIMIFQC